MSIQKLREIVLGEVFAWEVPPTTDVEYHNLNYNTYCFAIIPVQSRSDPYTPVRTHSNPFNPVLKMQHFCVHLPVQTRTRSNAFKMRSTCIHFQFATRSGMQQNVAFSYFSIPWFWGLNLESLGVV